MVILDKGLEKNVYYPVTTYKASKKLIKVYLEQKGGEEK